MPNVHDTSALNICPNEISAKLEMGSVLLLTHLCLASRKKANSADPDETPLMRMKMVKVC